MFFTISSRSSSSLGLIEAELFNIKTSFHFVGLTINQITLDVRKDNKTRETTSTGNAAVSINICLLKNKIASACTASGLEKFPLSFITFWTGVTLKLGCI